MHKKLLAIFVSILITGCAMRQPVEYKGGLPNLNLSGSAAQNEYDKFKLKQYAEYRLWTFQIQKSDELYTMSSFEPVVTAVSSDAKHSIEQAHLWQDIQLDALFVCTGVAVAELIVGHNDNKTLNNLQNLTFMTCAFSIASGLYARWKVGKATDQFNEDLKSKLSPSVSLNFDF